MAGLKLNLTKPDVDALKCFFSDKTWKSPQAPYLVLIVNWKSTTKINGELSDAKDRTRRRLEKLHSFGFLELEVIDHKERKDHYWYITREGFFYVFSTLTKKEMLAFLEGNKKYWLGIPDLEKIVKSNNYQIQYFKAQMTNIVKNHQYYLIKYFIDKWLADNAFVASTMEMPYPDMKKN